MLKFLSILLLVVSAIYTPNKNLLSLEQSEWVHWGNISYNAKEDAIFINSLNNISLDFSKLFSQLKYMEIHNNYIGYINIEYDLGLSKNTNLKNLVVYSGASQTAALSKAYLPSIELFQVIGSHNSQDCLSYIPEVMPSLKTLSLRFWWRSLLAETIKNISKLELLENLQIAACNEELWSGREARFSDQEIEALSLLYNLQSLTINVSIERSLPQFDEKQIQLLKDLLPNTKVEINVSYYKSSWDYN